MNRLLRVLAGASMALMANVCLSACGSGPTSSANAVGSVASPSVLPAGAEQVKVSAGAATPVDNSCNDGQPTASLAPQGPLPAPGDMPSGTFMATIAQRGYLIAGVDQNTLLWGYRTSSDAPLEGFDIDMVDAVAAAIFGPSWPDHIHYVVVPNSDRVADVANGTVDIVAETMTITCAREQMIDFSAEYYDAHQKVLVTKSSGINSEAALGGKRICAAQGSTSLTTLADDIRPAPILWAVANQTDCLVMLQQGQVDAISTDDTILEGLAAQDPNLEILNNVNLSDEPYGMGISKSHTDFTRFVNGVLAQEVADGQWKATWKTWLSGVVNTAPPAAPKPLYRD